ncbi:hypothetical protein ACS0TY_015144 [Phlomoides rotata]
MGHQVFDEMFLKEFFFVFGETGTPGVSFVGVKLPTIEVRYADLRVAAECQVVYGKPLPTLWNSLKSLISDVRRLPCFPLQDTHVDIINDVSGIIKPGRMTLLLGPPGCGKTTLFKSLSGNLDKSLKVFLFILFLFFLKNNVKSLQLYWSL